MPSNEKNQSEKKELTKQEKDPKQAEVDNITAEIEKLKEVINGNNNDIERKEQQFRKNQKPFSYASIAIGIAVTVATGNPLIGVGVGFASNFVLNTLSPAQRKLRSEIDKLENERSTARFNLKVKKEYKKKKMKEFGLEGPKQSKLERAIKIIKDIPFKIARNNDYPGLGNNIQRSNNIQRNNSIQMGNNNNVSQNKQQDKDKKPHIPGGMG